MAMRDLDIEVGLLSKKTEGVKEAPNVAAALSELSDELGNLDNALAVLFKRIDPVLREADPISGDPGMTSDSSESDLQREIRSKLSWINSLRVSVERVSSMVDL